MIRQGLTRLKKTVFFKFSDCRDDNFKEGEIMLYIPCNMERYEMRGVVMKIVFVIIFKLVGCERFTYVYVNLF